MPAPKAKVTLNGQPVEVTFDVATLLRIEEADSRSPFDIAQDLVDRLARPKPTPVEVGGGTTVVPVADKDALAHSIRVKDLAGFVGPCVGQKPAELKADPGELLNAYVTLASAFITAVGQLAGGGEEAEGPTVPTGAGSGPGLASSSA